MASDKTQLNSGSSSFAFLEYYLQLCLKATTARVTNSWALSNPHLTVTFENRCKDMLILDSWVDLDSLTAPNLEDDIVKRGFQFVPPVNGMKFQVGSIRPNFKHDIRSGNKFMKKLLLCKIGVGRSYFADEEYAKIGTLPDGYDSFYISPGKYEPSSATKDDIDNDYFHEYMIKDVTQVLPLYVATFEFDPVLERKSRDKTVCDNCESTTATIYCTADAAFLCHNCDQSLHSANKLMSKHIRTTIGQGPEVFGNCRQHPDKMVEFFCPTCHVPVCVYCKMVGHHSSGEAARHKLTSVQEAYKSVLDNSQADDPILKARIAAIENQLNNIGAQAKLVEKNSSEIKAQIEELYKKALNDLKVMTKKKLTVLKGDECELYRQLGEVSRLEEFLKYQQSGGDRTQFLLNWGRHLQLRSELHAFRFFRDSIDVQADIKCGGNIHIHVDPSSGGQKAKATANNAPTNGTTNTLSQKKANIYEAIATGKPRLPVGVSKASDVKVRRTSDFFAETLHALEIGQESQDGNDLDSIQEGEVQ